MSAQASEQAPRRKREPDCFDIKPARGLHDPWGNPRRPVPEGPRVPERHRAEVARIEATLDELVGFAGKHDKRPHCHRFRAIARQSPKDLAEVIAGNTLCVAALLAVRRLGERLYDLGGLDLLDASLTRVAKRDQKHTVVRDSLLRQACDRIGDFVA
jgi:hypothetical protein